MKITGLPLKELRQLLPRLRATGGDVDIFILSETEKGSDYVHASKLIELRNTPKKAVLVLVPSNSRTSAEDSYGDATFQNLPVAMHTDSFLWKLQGEIPHDRRLVWEKLSQLFKETHLSKNDMTRYLIYVEMLGFSDEAWGNGLFLLGMLPDSGLVGDLNNMRRRFMINHDKLSPILSDFSATAADRVAALPIKDMTVKKELMKLLSSDDSADDPVSLFEKVAKKSTALNFNNLPLELPSNNDPVKITVELMPGKDPKRELVKDAETGNLALSIPQNKKSKVPMKVTVTPTPKENPDIYFYEIAIFDIEDFSEIGVIRKTKIGEGKSATKRMSISIAGDTFPDGTYGLRIRALNKDGILLENNMAFKEEDIQAEWGKAKQGNDSLDMEQFRRDNKALYCNESEPFTINNNIEESEIAQEIDKRAKASSLTQAYINYRIKLLLKKAAADIEMVHRSPWIEGTLVNSYHFDFGVAYAYQIQLPRKLLQLESTLLENSAELGYVEALVTSNPTDPNLYNPASMADRKPHFVRCENLTPSDELAALRSELFETIRESAAGDSGVVATFDLPTNIGRIKEYLSEYERWLNEMADSNSDEATLLAVQDIDTVRLSVELPNGQVSETRLISPLHPLRLAWMVNLYDLYIDWETKTLEQPDHLKYWRNGKFNALFQSGLPLDIAPLTIQAGSLTGSYHYIGELTFGWGMYALASQPNATSGQRQLKAYTATLLNITRERRVESDVSLELVVRHLFNYAKSHPYTDKLIVNLFNAGDASVFAKALILLEQAPWNIGKELTYEFRLFVDNGILKSGEAFDALIDPQTAVAEEAEAFSQSSGNRLTPKLRYSINKVSDFIDNPDKYQAHISFLINPFAVATDMTQPNDIDCSFHLNGVVCRNVVRSATDSKSVVWRRYFSDKVVTTPVTETANTEVGIFSRLQAVTGRLLSSTRKGAVPTTLLRLGPSEKTLLSFVHDKSDWVVTFDRNMGPDFYDMPCSNDKEIPYMLDYIPGNDSAGISSFLTAKPTSEFGHLIVPLFAEYGIDLSKFDDFRLFLEDIRTISSSIVMQVNSSASRSFEVIGSTLAKRFLQKKHITEQSFIIPIDLHRELFDDMENDKKERADTLVVKINPADKELLFTVVEIKCRNAGYSPEELHKKIVSQIENTIAALRYHYEIEQTGHDRLDRELKTLELRSLLEFYVRRAMRFKQLVPDNANSYLQFLNKLGDGYTIRFKQLGIIFDFNCNDMQKKDFCGDTTIYTMGKPVIDKILDNTSSLDTLLLEQSQQDLVDFFEPTISQTSLIQDNDNYDELDDVYGEHSVCFSTGSNTEATDGTATSEKETPAAPESTVVDSQKSGLDEFESTKPKYDVIIGATGDSRQYGIMGKTVSNGRTIAVDLDGCNTISLFGVQGAGKSYTIGSVTEMLLRPFGNVNSLPSPMAGVIFHYSDSMDYAPEFTSMVYPNDEAAQLAKLKAEYGAEPGSIKDVILLAPESQVETRKNEYPDIEVHPIGFDSSELVVHDWLFLLGAMGNESTYIKELKQIMKSCRKEMSLDNIRKGVSESGHLSTSQRSLAEQRLDFAQEYIRDGCRLSQFLKPGRLIIVDLRDEFIEKDEALGLFVVMLNIFSSVLQVDGKAFNKFIVFDEAHKYMNNKELANSITTAIREMRHKGVSIMIASQDPMSLPTEIIELSSMVIMHKFSSPGWVKHVQKAITPLQFLTPTEMASLGSGEAYLWANKASDKAMTIRPTKIRIRPRLTKHGGDTINAVR